MPRIAAVLALLLLPNLAQAAYSCDPGGWITTIGFEAVAKEEPRGPDTPIEYYFATLECRGGMVGRIVHTSVLMTPNQVAEGAGGAIDTYNTRGLATSCQTAFYFVHKYYEGTVTNSLDGQLVTVDFADSPYPVGEISEAPFNDTFTGGFEAQGCGECPAGESVTATVEEMHDGCYKGCEVTDLYPTKENEWVRTLEGEYTGDTCEDTEADGDSDKMYACAINGGGPDTSTDNPINFATGNKFFIESDYRGSGAFPITFTRTYNSYDLGWRFAYTQRIEREDEDTVLARRPDGRTFAFRRDNGGWHPDPDVTARLRRLTADDEHGPGWVYIRPDHTRERYDGQGRLTALQNPQGKEQTLSYAETAGGPQVTVTDPHGQELRIALNPAGTLPERITDARGRTTEYHYKDGLILTRVDHPDGTATEYLYEDPERPWLITGVLDENGDRSRRVEYDDQGRAIASERGGGAERVEVRYEGDDTTTLTNALGKRTTYRFETLHGVKKIIQEQSRATAHTEATTRDYAYDANGYLIAETDAKGHSTYYTRDENGLELSRTEALGEPAERTVTTQWDTDLRKPRVVTEGDLETRYTYDDEGRTVSRTETDLTTGATRTTRYTYTADGRLKTVDGPRDDVADVTTYRYDAAGRLSRVTNAAGHTTEIVERDGLGRPTLIRDPNGLETAMAYDGRGRLVERSVGGETTALEYDDAGNLVRVTEPGGATLEYTYDAAGRVTALRDGEGNRIEYTLDAAGNRTEERIYDDTGSLARIHKRAFDALSRTLKSIGARGQTTRHAYDANGNRTRTTDPLGRVHRNAYDALNRLLEQTDPLGGETRYDHDDQDRVTAVTDPNGNTTTYEYNAFGDRVERTSPDTGTTTYEYDAAGNLVAETDAKGQTTTHTYDALNRRTRTAFADGSEIVYTYDSAENGIGRLAEVEDPSGRTEYQYDAHGRGTRRTQTIATGNGSTQALTTRYAYNRAGQLAELTYPSGMTVGYAYENGKIRKVTVNGETVVRNVAHAPFGPVAGWTWSDGTRHRRTYDQDGRLVEQTLAGARRDLAYDPVGNITGITDPADSRSYDYDALDRLTEARADTFNLAWAYDANGNRTERTDHQTGETTDYTIAPDSNRLQAVADTAFEHDANGNLIEDGDHTYHYNARNRLVDVDDGATARYRYNAAGQRVYKRALLEEGADPDLNGDGEVTEADLHVLQEYIRQGDAPVSADLNGDGEVNGQDTPCIATRIGADKNQGRGKGRNRKAERAHTPEHDKGPHGCLPVPEPETRLYAYDEWRMLGAYDADGAAVQETVWLGDLPIATVRDGKVYHVHTDHLGTPRAVTDPTNGAAVWRWTSDPFGRAKANEDPDGNGKEFTYNLRFPGQYYDQETGKHYNYFRDYESGIGGYIQPDPIGLKGGSTNLYGYVKNNPVNLRDPRGEEIPTVAWCGLAAAVYGGTQLVSSTDQLFESTKLLRRQIERIDKRMASCSVEKYRELEKIKRRLLKAHLKAASKYAESNESLSGELKTGILASGCAVLLAAPGV
ncbi:hypothetical protein AN478_02655 [Thiohalorhabdus denitrificans]|uniref:RHS repeat-associated core domain-containing protein n=1 Tax=Thiohalorhabdus denitrificans TaxID=381306 RepID=A0A0P9CQG1_9GAMM|nr:RHS repeat-associated core domain-containing protein [Thiohalorhabdus denitrificans]KPV41487.1 hypothetical protein AN478_02655 [Thiohalorhabdus denitrificans]SCY29155.1 RHS repeat-associated core domain-containing protein [Thiohalorhabdus denitrificans]